MSVIEYEITDDVDTTVVRFQHGKAASGSVLTKLPDEASSFWFTPFPRDPDYDAVTSRLRATAERCAPWVNVIVGPRLMAIAEPEDDLAYFQQSYETAAGTAYVLGGVVIRGNRLVLMGMSTGHPEATLHHELWHVLENHMSMEDIQFFNDTLGPPEGDNPYYDSLLERRARAYEAWVIRYESGIPLKSVCGFPVRRMDRILLSAYAGTVAKERAAGKSSPARMLPGERALRAVVDEIGFGGIAAAVAGLLMVCKLLGVAA